MILYSGSQALEFKRQQEVQFGTAGEALSWLKHLGPPDSEVLHRFRDLLNRYAEDPDSARLTDHQVLERVAVLLYNGRISVIGSPAPFPGSPP